MRILVAELPAFFVYDADTIRVRDLVFFHLLIVPIYISSDRGDSTSFGFYKYTGRDLFSQGSPGSWMFGFPKFRGVVLGCYRYLTDVASRPPVGHRKQIVIHGIGFDEIIFVQNDGNRQSRTRSVGIVDAAFEHGR